MPQRRSEIDAGWTTRCGRCAKLLPDETLSFCPACGIPFSKIPPTDSYILFEEGRAALGQRRRRVHITFASAVAFFALGAGFLLNASSQLAHRVDAIAAQREVIIYNYDLPQFPALPAANRRLGIALGLQAFSDHFSMSLANVQIHEGQFPVDAAEIFHGPWRQEFARLSYWEHTVLRRLLPRSGSSLNQSLPVIITNIPLTVDTEANPTMETRHLSNSGLISGVGSPAFVLVSTYRMLSKDPEFRAARPALRNDFDQAHYLGEYLLAHEMGHALLGLADYVIEDAPSLRAPASIGGSAFRCLMHTDSGGGVAAWRDMRDRTVGSPSPCRKYSTVLDAFALRGASLELLRTGRRAQAERLHAQALAQIAANTNPWMAELLRQEQNLFLPALKYWWTSNFVIQSRNDQL